MTALVLVVGILLVMQS